MSVFQPLPLGRRIPDRLHAVSCSIPTMRDLRGYETKDPETLSRMSSGYPRFVVHPLVRRLADVLGGRAGLTGRRLWLASSERMAADLGRYLSDPSARPFSAEGVFGLSHEENAEFAAKAKTYLQHTGGFLSSRLAEDLLVKLGELPRAQPEALQEGDARASAWRSLAPLFQGASEREAFFTPSGINAVYSAFSAVADMQAQRGRTLWVQLGWLYLDTIAIMKKFTRFPGAYAHVVRVDDRAGLEALFAERGNHIAGMIAEVPTNPLIQTPDIPWLSSLARRHGARLVLDPSVASIYSVDLLPYADVLVTSLTKYSAHEGDLIAGLAVVNPEGPDAAELRWRLAARVEPVYARDLARLCAQLEAAPAMAARIEENVRVVARFLEQRPEVAKVHWACSGESGRNFAALARRPESTGGMLSFELKLPMEPFFDAVRLPKGPSFGMVHTLLCPFIWLAHFDLVTTEAGRAELAASGINPDLMRLAPGVEPAAELIAALTEAFEVAAR